jgi:hypothetical protein
LNRTLSPYGDVSRGVCVTDADGRLQRIDERKRVRLRGDACEYLQDDGMHWRAIPGGALASMNMWGFRPGFISDLAVHFEKRLLRGLDENPLDFEETLAAAVQDMLQRGAGEVRILPTLGRWIGMTYRADRVVVIDGISSMIGAGLYPQAF